MLGLPYFAVIPAGTSQGKQALIRQFGGECVLLQPGQCCKHEAERRARESGGYFLDQFTNAAIAVDWRAHNVVAELMEQIGALHLPEPDWFITGAGTGGTATCAGRYFRNTHGATRVLVVDPEDSAFYGHYSGAVTRGCLCASRIEGIGRPTVEPSFRCELVDRMLRVPDAASCAAARWLSMRLQLSVGLSTGTHLIGAISLFDAGEASQLATLISDGGARYAGRLDNDEWLAEQRLDIRPWLAALDAWYEKGRWQPPV